MDTLESLSRKIAGATDIKSVVRTMKAMAAANIGQYELAVGSLSDYYNTVALGLVGYFRSVPIEPDPKTAPARVASSAIGAVVFGSDQGLVGSFNNTLAEFVGQTLDTLPGTNEIWSVGDRIQLLLLDRGLPVSTHFSVPASINTITPLVGQILVKAQEYLDEGTFAEFYIFHNQPKEDTGYVAVCQRLLPLDAQWKRELTAFTWPTRTIPQVIGPSQNALLALIREFLFVSLFRACAESLASENASRLMAMQRAEKNINELLDNLGNEYHRTRQSTIDEELFDVVSGFEALNGDKAKGGRG
jgi:F-type H+-transporting ATPase subunit gamma